jgi:hypothetical protein
MLVRLDPAETWVRLVPAESGGERNGVQIKRISPLEIAGTIEYDTILPLFREK